MSVEELRKKGYVMTEQEWLNVSFRITLFLEAVLTDCGKRCIFLETIAGIPGMAAATIRHLHSLRLMVRKKPALTDLVS